ncbi:unnamed protein product [Linum tenue]|uniref:Uncharacterized protein n=1 Tax=Linum tenue TaxID=586396 RepID=A0AAV0HZQ2_9ROSI|nr:unnamed protein product [Linum tenue]
MWKNGASLLLSATLNSGGRVGSRGFHVEGEGEVFESFSR